MFKCNSIWGLSANFLYCSTHFVQPQRTVFILRRKNPIRVSKLCSSSPKKLKRRHYYYELVEDTDVKKKPPLEVVLTQDVSGLGMKGETIKENIYIAYRDLLLPKLAVYPNSPEAKALRKDTEVKAYSSIYTKIVEHYLSSKPVSIILNNDKPWTLQPWHVKLALRANGILTNEDCITVPKEISGPDSKIENKDFIVYVTMNKSERFPLRCRIYHWSNVDPVLNQKSFDVNSPSEPLFLDEKEEVDALLELEKEAKKAKKLRGYTVKRN